MKITVDPKVLEMFPQAKIAVLIASGLENSHALETFQLLKKIDLEVKKEFTLDALTKVPKIIDWREAYRKFGFPPSSFRSPVESLLRRILQEKPLPAMNPVSDISHYVSIKHMVPLTSFDLDKVEKGITLVFAEGDEHFVKAGTEEKIQEREMIYRDDKEVICRGWNFKESEKTKVSKDSKNICFVLEGLENTSHAELEKALHELKALLTQFCGGTYEHYFLGSPQRPAYFEHEEFQNRSKKMEELKSLGIDPYPHIFTPENHTLSLQNRYRGEVIGDSEKAAEGSTPETTVAGRLMLFRPMGKNAFGQLQDHTGTLQIMFNRELTIVKGFEEEGALKFIEKKFDLGDILGVKGHLFHTQVGELTLFVKEVTLLSKALLPLPDKHSGLSDKGVRYRKRWLDLITSSAVRKQFETRSQVIRLIRSHLEEKGFLEVETPILQNIYGGAEARPFVTHLNSLNQEMFLRISLEISLKKLVIGGIDQIFELSKVFRNEGIDRTHNPEFTMLELYAAYWDYNDMMELQEQLFEKIALHLFGSTEVLFTLDGVDVMVDVKAPWKRLTMKESIEKYAHLNVDEKEDEALREHLRLHTKLKEEELKEMPRGLLIASLFAELVENHLIQPHFIVDHPIETTPLCKPHRDPKKRAEGLIERFESFILGSEYSNAYTELNDPLLQRSLLEEQATKKQKGNEEAHPMDEEFIEALCQGMPPTGGLGIGIDRLIMLFTNAHSIRDVIYFPLMRPEE